MDRIRTEIIALIKAKKYHELLRYYIRLNNGQFKEAINKFQYSKRSLKRYLNTSRKVPMDIVSKISKEYNIGYNEIFDTIESKDKIAFKPSADILFNTLYILRTKIKEITLFEEACELNIQEDILEEYETGKRAIQPLDIEKILNYYQIKLNELFAQLVSYDGMKTFLPLKLAICPDKVNLLGNDFKIHDYYMVDDDDFIFEKIWPMQRYDNKGKKLLKYMPTELSIDEYFNIDFILFLKEDGKTYYRLQKDNLKLPPNYQNIAEVFFGNKKKTYDRKGYDIRISSIKFMENYKLLLSGKRFEMEIDLSSYINTDSIWYKELKENDYLQKGKLDYIGDKLPQNQCIVWPNGQYVRIIDHYMMDFNCFFELESIRSAGSGMYENWLHYNCRTRSKAAEIEEKSLKVKELRDRGMKWKDITTTLGVSEPTARNWLHYNYPTRTRAAEIEEKSLKVKELRDRGMKWKDITTTLGVSEPTARNWLHYNYPTRTRAAEVEEKILKTKELREHGMKWKDIATTLGVAEITARKYGARLKK